MNNSTLQHMLYGLKPRVQLAHATAATWQSTNHAVTPAVTHVVPGTRLISYWALLGRQTRTKWAHVEGDLAVQLLTLAKQVTQSRGLIAQQQ
jgi:hypothetical protein